MNATALVLAARHRVEVTSYELPEPRPDELVVRTEFSGVSQGTEMDAFRGQRPELRLPTVTGYQAVGIAERVGASVRGFAPGGRVLFTSSRLPESFPPTWMGTHVSRALVPARTRPLPVPEDVDPIEAALAALVGVALGGLAPLEIRLGDVALVNGQGMIGQCAAQLARLRGARVVATDLSERRLEHSRRASADLVLRPDVDDVAAALRELAPRGADLVIETTGRADQFDRCVELLRAEGQLLLQGYYKDRIGFEFHSTHLKKPRIAIACGYADLDLALRLMGWKKLRLRELVTHVAAPKEAPDLFAAMERGDPNVLGVVFDWRA